MANDGDSEVTYTFESLARTRFEPARGAELASRAAHAVVLSVGTRALGVRFSQAAAAVRFAERYRELATEREPDFTLFAVDDGDDAFFWADAGQRVWHWSGGPLHPEVVAFFADSAALYEFLCGSHVLGFHAAALTAAAGAFALIGETTAGKTTTAVACARRGARLYSDERCLIEDGLVPPFLRRMTLRPGGRAALLADPYDEPLGIDRRLRAWEGDAEVVVRPNELFGGSAGGRPVPLDAVFVIDGHAARPQILPTNASDVMRSLLGSMASRESGLDRIARILRELREARIYRLRLGPPDATARAILATVAEPLAR